MQSQVYTVKVWDGVVRLSHWLIVLLTLSAWGSAHYGDIQFKWHFFNGYTLLTVILSRIIWAFVGSTTARISHFLTSPLVALKYLRDLFYHQENPVLGHNPAGGWMVITLWLILLAQVITGLFSSDDILVDGPLSHHFTDTLVSAITTLHHQLFNILIILVSIHLLAVLYHQWIKKELLTKAMINGRKTIPKTLNNQLPTLIFRSNYFAAIIVSFIAISVWCLKVALS